ncbi:hypothetical protein KUH03_31075 [Sphingobacterium sp. E70]|uniref:hypothetical protein n=1 Tax=Sphingobacterium sp. E70 TaxID=2853439 RepID=UPI00211C2624|nr:hypothetical protein [Sphingobacterium sp. E70]ULT23579.1 hypothetical protein KUH03_31075 [Sphingobacterium sp. E70]
MLSLQSCVDYCLDNEEDLFLFITDCYAKILDFDIEEVIKDIEVPLVRVLTYFC